MTLPDGVVLRPLTTHSDDRGSLTEMLRGEWLTGPDPVQWNVVSTEASVLRGVHVHLRHWDYLVLVQGSVVVGLRDLRRESPTFGLAVAVEMSDACLAALTVPPGVAHGFYFHKPSLHVYGVTHYWEVDDELGCRWDDPALEIPWSVTAARISPRDADLPSLSGLMMQLADRPVNESSAPPVPATR